MDKLCQTCQTQNEADARYCEGCGMELPDQQKATGTPPVSQESVPEQLVQDTEHPSTAVDLHQHEKPKVGTTLEQADVDAVLIPKKHGAFETDSSIELRGQRLLIGRFDPSSGPVDIDLTGLTGAEHSSRRHAELYREEGLWKIKDMGSLNGIFVKRSGEVAYSTRLEEATELRDGDEVAIGNVQFLFRES